MKIKEVCEKTGLTDRAIRYYIECGLLTPTNTENYTGRKQYTFTREDAERLETIKQFRGVGFSVEQIKRLFQNRCVRDVVQERLRDLEIEQKRCDRLYETLKKADMDREVSVEELAIIVSGEATTATEEPFTTEKAPSTIWMRLSNVHILLMGLLLYGAIVTVVLLNGFQNWIDLQWHLFPLYIVLMIISYALHNSRWWIKSITAVVICAVMLLPVEAALIIGEPRQLGDEAYTSIQEIPWEQEELFLANGFTRVEEHVLEYNSDDFTPPLPYPSKYYDRSWLRVTVWDADAEDLQLSKDHKRYGGAYVAEHVRANYSNIFEKWMVSPDYIERRYSILIDGYRIDVWEMNYEDRRINYFEEWLKEIRNSHT